MSAYGDKLGGGDHSEGEDTGRDRAFVVLTLETHVIVSRLGRFGVFGFEALYKIDLAVSRNIGAEDKLVMVS